MSVLHRVLLGTLCFVCVAASACAPTINEKDRAKARIQYDIGVAQMNQGDMRGALRDLLSALRFDPYLFETHNALGLVYHGLGQLKDALDHYRVALELRPKSPETQNNMGVLLVDMGRYDEAIAAFDAALSDILYATPSMAEGNLGWAYYKKGDVQQGVRHLRNAVATNPKFCRGYLWLASIGMERGELEQVLRDQDRFTRQCLNDEEIAPTLGAEHVREMRYYAGLAFAQKGDVDKAREVLGMCATDAEGGFGHKCSEALRGL